MQFVIHFCYFCCCDGVRLSVWSWAADASIFRSPDDTRVTGYGVYGFWQPIPVPLYPPQIPYWLSWARTRASAARSRRLTARAMAWPYRAMLIKTRTKFGMKFRWTNRLLLLPPSPRLWVSGRLQHAYFILISLVYLQCKKISCHLSPSR
jgi:hypothetical protein